MAIPSTLPAPTDPVPDRVAVQVVATRAALRELLRMLHQSGAIDLARYADSLERLAIEHARVGAEEGPEACGAAVSDDLADFAHVSRTDAVLIAGEQGQGSGNVS